MSIAGCCSEIKTASERRTLGYFTGFETRQPEVGPFSLLANKRSLPPTSPSGKRTSCWASCLPTPSAPTTASTDPSARRPAASCGPHMVEAAGLCGSCSPAEPPTALPDPGSLLGWHQPPATAAPHWSSQQREAGLRGGSTL